MSALLGIAWVLFLMAAGAAWRACFCWPRHAWTRWAVIERVRDGMGIREHLRRECRRCGLVRLKKADM